MAAIQLSFSLRVSSSVKTVHLLGSWDNYAGQLPLAKDKTSSKSGSWKGTFRFQGTTLQPGQRYWYYYIIDGYHVSHDPAVSSTTEPTTGRVLNILDVPVEKSSSRSSKSSSSSSKHSSSSSSKHSSSSKSSHSSHSSSRRESRRDSHLSVDIPKGRPLSISQIKSPKPMSPHATKHILEADYAAGPTVDELTARFGATTMDEYDYDYDLPGSPSSSVGSTISDTSGTSSPSSASSMSDYSSGSNASSCTCERYGITRKGDRIKLDCGGSRCGSSDSESCSSEDEADYSRSSRRNGIVVRR
ncbi:uncharacterized protein EAF02_005469 [Botrytis sinoallii]|uniref:AMP-activated protein kinase glycogen-binding domain-containing protein n=2 Tax=Sclerotiniaceae TaxID=28983 RepID=A0A4Z1IVN2_9HELO|nr:uncharacterized protein EAF02_005469 [Botrytis sinoallii]KAF7883549.1 hypothetical protein EAF02_005469 [Botrytis sinoallii]TGO30829.1 hypothetical protein BPAE_0003g01140 [Botrytis paeoniae]TGO60627.1 hypothetical protein BCON_0034g00630 [Botryotinia convoluta]